MSEQYIVRFSLRQRFEHLFMMVTFAVLALTGLPQRFSDAGWARWLIRLFGGLESARWYHRMAGLAFAAFLVIHVLITLTAVLRRRARPSMVPTRKDFADAIITLRYYLRMSDQQARFDRYDYRQKFEYWGLLLGGVIMVVTGLMLYFPTVATAYLPGQVIPAAKVAHSNEGLMAFLVVIIWHIYNSTLAPEVFPFDASIFTGKISKHRMEHEHPVELERIEAEKRAAGEPAPGDNGGPGGTAG